MSPLNRIFSRQRFQGDRTDKSNEQKVGVKIGYERVSTSDQRLDAQLHQLRADGCDEVFSDHGVSGGKKERSGLNDALDKLVAGDTLVVTKLDRLGRSLLHLIELLADLKERGVQFRSIHDAIDTSTASGQLHFTMICALAEFERALVSERTKAGLAAAKAQGVKFGRRPKLTYEQVRMAHALVHGEGEQKRTQKSVAKSFGVSDVTLRREFRKYQLDKS